MSIFNFLDNVRKTEQRKNQEITARNLQQHIMYGEEQANYVPFFGEQNTQGRQLQKEKFDHVRQKTTEIATQLYGDPRMLTTAVRDIYATLSKRREQLDNLSGLQGTNMRANICAIIYLHVALTNKVMTIQKIINAANKIKKADEPAITTKMFSKAKTLVLDYLPELTPDEDNPIASQIGQLSMTLGIKDFATRAKLKQLVNKFDKTPHLVGGTSPIPITAARIIVYLAADISDVNGLNKELFRAKLRADLNISKHVHMKWIGAFKDQMWGKTNPNPPNIYKYPIE
jgi:hypothetical protein